MVRHGDLRQPREGRAAPRAAQGVIALRRVEVVRTFLSLDPARFRAAPQTTEHADARILRHDPCPVAVYRRLYHDVGAEWYWHDRTEWTDEQLAAHLGNPNVGVWEMRVNGESAGYFELQRHDDDSIEVAYFGLVSKFIGRGLGGMLLTAAVREAWSMAGEPTRVWLHTCTLDSPNALPAYRARGFQPFRTQRLEVDIEGDHVVRERLVQGGEV